MASQRGVSIRQHVYYVSARIRQAACRHPETDQQIVMAHHWSNELSAVTVRCERCRLTRSARWPARGA